MISTRRAARTALAITLAGTLALAACGDDDSDDAATDAGSELAADEGAAGASSSAAEDNAEFCGAFLALDRAFAQAPEDPAEIEAFAAESITPNVATVRESAPDAISEHVLVMADTVDTFLSGGGDFSAFETPEFTEASGNVYPSLGEVCGLQQVDVTAVDYGFEGVPDTLEAGDTVFTLANDSEAGEFHEIGIMKLRDGVDLSVDELLALPEEEAQQHLDMTSSAGAFAPVGAVTGTTVELTPGRYVYVCFIPVGTVGEAEGSGPPHFMEGMAGEFVVE